MLLSVQLSPKFWVLNAIISLAGAFCLLAIAVISVFLVRHSRGNANSSILGPLILLAMLFVGLSSGLVYAFNEASRTASFRVMPTGVAWTNWKQAHSHPWREIGGLVLKRGNKGWDILEIRCRKNAVEFDILQIDSTQVRNFAALLARLEQASGLRCSASISYPPENMRK